MSIYTQLVASDPRTGLATPLPSIDTSPIPLPRRESPDPFPVEALGELLGEAATAIAYYVQAPLGMAAQSVLAVASLAVQGHVNVRKGNLGTSPTTLYCITIAASGERKSSVDNLAMKPIYELQAERRAEYPDRLAEYKAELEAFDVRYNSILKSYKGSGKSQSTLSQHDQDALAGELADLEKRRPTPPPRAHILMEEPTAEGIYKHFEEGLPIAGLFSDEGGAFFSGHGMSDEAKGRTITMLSQIWDGKPITRTRAGAGESGVIAGRRLSSHLMVQPVIADKLYSDPLLMGQGFLPRFLPCCDASLMGKRLLGQRPFDENPGNDPALVQFWKEIDQLIRQPLPTNDCGELQPEDLVICGDAYTAWANVHDSFEEQLAPHGEYTVIREFTAKAADNVARIAAVISYIESRSAPTIYHIARAAQLMHYYLMTMIRRVQDASHNASEHEALELYEWMQRNGGELASDDFKRLPAAIRRARKARELLSLLVDNGYATVSAISGPKGKPRAWKLRTDTRDAPLTDMED